MTVTINNLFKLAQMSSTKVLKKRKNRGNKVHLVFDEEKRRDFLTGFHKRKVQRKKEAKERLERDLKSERKRLKSEAKESYKKLVVSHRSIPELETLLKEEYEDNHVTVRIEELSTSDMAARNNLMGTNRPICDASNDVSDDDNKTIESDQIPGMELVRKTKGERVHVKKTFESERQVKKILKREATKKVQKSKVFQMKHKIEKAKQIKKSLHAKKERSKIREGKKRH